MSDSLDRAMPPLEPGDLEPYYVAPPLPRQDRVWLHIVLFLMTVVTTTLVGALHYWGFTQGFNADAVVFPDFRDPSLYLNGLWYSATVLGILGCHEMGHYVACRYYRVDASLPFFLPAPLPLTGTLGAFIRIRDRIPSKVALFDIGLSGPIAGFLVAVPALVMGLTLSATEQLPADFTGLELGEPLLFRFASWLVWGDLPDGVSINMHPMAFAAWFGLLATALNLFPIGQLDGGHVAYAVLGRGSALLTLLMVCVAIGLTIFSMSWLIWTILMVVMLAVMGPHHPPTLDDDMQMDRTRLILAVVGLVMLIICFTPAPIEPFVTGQ
ncbi:MAG TPA: site-2 protease family protein [Vicinamibacterales bacterium]|nr:site-2 protease family protein [Vicinamibacterales bacterium]